MLAELAEQLIRFHLTGPEETITHIISALRLAEAGIAARLTVAPTVDEQAERRRAADRERKRRGKVAMVDGGISAEIPQNAEETVSPKKAPYNPKKTTPSSNTKNPLAPLPEDWKPNTASIDLAARLRLDALAMSLETSRFASWAASNDVRKADWDAAFDFWLANGKPKVFKPHGGDRGNVVKASFPSVKTIFIKEGTPQWDAWVAAGHRRTMKSYKGGDAGWDFPSEWPPEATRTAV